MMVNLTTSYRIFLLSYLVALVVVGVVSLILQDSIAEWLHPGEAASFQQAALYQYWVYHDSSSNDGATTTAAFTNPKEKFLALYVSGMLIFEGSMLVVVNLDKNVPAQTKTRAMYCSMAVDVWFIKLFCLFPHVVHYNHIIGSVLFIAARWTFALLGPSYRYVIPQEDNQHVKLKK